ncbi:MAG TPA: hypothetical protein VN890_09430 [Methylocella sp.]|nr:hypothetical protein [Methylocella sp.]
MDLHDNKYRAMTVVSCLEATWSVLRDRVTVAVTDRFLSPIILQNFPSEAAAQEMIKARLAQSYAEYRFTPPHASWPFAQRAFATTAGFSLRQLLKACEDHRQSCLTQGKVFELQSFQNQATEPPQLPPSNEFERLYETAKRDADLAKVWNHTMKIGLSATC